MKIPKSFKLFSTTIKVEINDQRMDDHNAYGYYEHSRSIITLATKDGVHELSEDRILDSFYHEKVHSILSAMYEEELNKNERFVDTFAKLLRQSDETTTFNTNNNG